MQKPTDWNSFVFNAGVGGVLEVHTGQGSSARGSGHGLTARPSRGDDHLAARGDGCADLAGDDAG